MANTLLFLEELLEEMPFPIQRIQTNRGLEFFAESVQSKLMELPIKFRPNKPESSHWNGKVERSQKTDRIKFDALNDLPYEHWPKSWNVGRRLIIAACHMDRWEEKLLCKGHVSWMKKLPTAMKFFMLTRNSKNCFELLIIRLTYGCNN